MTFGSRSYSGGLATTTSIPYIEEMSAVPCTEHQPRIHGDQAHMMTIFFPLTSESSFSCIV